MSRWYWDVDHYRCDQHPYVDIIPTAGGFGIHLHSGQRLLRKNFLTLALAGGAVEEIVQ